MAVNREEWIKQHEANVGRIKTSPAIEAWWSWVETCDWNILLETYEDVGRKALTTGRSYNKLAAIQAMYNTRSGGGPASARCDHCRNTGACHVVRGGKYPYDMRILSRSRDLRDFDGDLIVSTVPCMCDVGLKIQRSHAPSQLHVAIVRRCSYPLGPEAQQAIYNARPPADNMDSITFQQCYRLLERVSNGEPKTMSAFRQTFRQGQQERRNVVAETYRGGV